MSIKKYNISKPEKYAGKDGQEKTIWHNVGIITEFHKQDGGVSRIIEIPAISLRANIFEIKSKEPQKEPASDNGIGIQDNQSDDLPF